MKKSLFMSIAAAAILTLSFAFPQLIENYKVNPSASQVIWTGSKITGDSHTGTITIKQGNLRLEDGKLKGGSFSIDMLSITCTDITDKSSNKRFVNHLHSDDFFSTATYPEATFIINSIIDKGENKYNITGDLNIKGKAESVSFLADIITEDDSAVATATIIFDRSLFGVRYGSDSFFDNLGDKAISNEIKLDIKIYAESTNSKNSGY